MLIRLLFRLFQIIKYLIITERGLTGVLDPLFVVGIPWINFDLLVT